MTKRSPARQAATDFGDAAAPRRTAATEGPFGLHAIKGLYDRFRRRSAPATAPARDIDAANFDVPNLPAGERIYAIGDVHGRADLLRGKFAAIDQHLSEHPVQRQTVVLLGDYIDRGQHSRDVVELILQRRQTGNVIALAGNHEALLLDFLSRPQTYPAWAKLGGAETLMSYGVAPPPTYVPEQLPALADTLGNAMPPAHIEFLKTLPLAFSRGGFLFVHAGVRPGVSLDRQVAADILWIRDDFLDHRGDFGAVIVHGHSRVVQPDIRPNRINIDTGAYISSRLTCLVLDENGLSFL